MFPPQSDFINPETYICNEAVEFYLICNVNDTAHDNFMT